MMEETPHENLTDHEKLVLIWNDHFEMKRRINRLYWMMPFVSIVSLMVGAIAERFAHWLEKVLA